MDTVVRLAGIGLTVLVLGLVVGGCTTGDPGAALGPSSALPAKPSADLDTSSPAEINHSTANHGTGSPVPTTDSVDLAPTFQGTTREYVKKMVDCLHQAGFDVQINDNGDGWGDPTLPEAQVPAMNAAADACILQIGQIQTKNFTDEQLASMYAGVHKQYDCLRTNGFPTDQAPTLQAYQDRAHQSGAPDWNAMSAVPREQIPAALSACPNPVDG